MTGDIAALRPFGDRGYVVEFAHELSPAINGRVRALADRLRDLPEVMEVVPTLRSALVVIDPLAPDRDGLADRIRSLAAGMPSQAGRPGRTIELPVVYGGEAGPDLPEVARLCGLTMPEVIEHHSASAYTVYMLGFAPGYPYMGILPAALRTARLATPRVRVPAGSVAVAETLTGVYPLDLPGGWRIIGRTPRPVYDPRERDPILFRPGDRVRFVPVSQAEFPGVPLGTTRLAAPARPVFEVHRPGLYTTVQDLGRVGYRSLGLPAAGAMDPSALRLANVAAGNVPGAAAIECTAPGPTLRVVEEATIAVTGADLAPLLDGRTLAMWSPVRVGAGQAIEFGAPQRGTWAYLAVTGGIDVPAVLGSAATYVPGGLGGAGGRRLAAGDVLGRGAGNGRPARAVPPLDLPEHEAVVRVIPGPQDDWFSEDALAAFWTSAYRVTLRADRAGVRLEGPAVLRRRQIELLSDGVLAGAVQIPPDGQPIVIMPDGPTTGGYPKIGVVASADLRLVAQARPGTRVKFVPTTPAEALRALRQGVEP